MGLEASYPEGTVLIAGTGAMGCLFAARFAAVGIPVAMYGTWEDGLTALEQRGVRIMEADGRVWAHPVRVLRGHAEGFKARLALVAVKSWQTGRAAAQLGSWLTSDGLALTIQNGLGNKETLEEALGADRVALGVTTYGATLLAPGLVRSAGEGLISINGGKRLVELSNLLRRAGFRLELVSEANSLVWGKLVINAAINPLTAILRVTNGELLDRPERRQLMAELANEAASVASAMGVKLPYSDPPAAAEAVARRTAANRSSMLQDMDSGRPTEIDAICGAIVVAGEQLGLPTPANRLVWRLIRSMEGQATMNEPELVVAK